jgi:hypothetical protein
MEIRDELAAAAISGMLAHNLVFPRSEDKTEFYKNMAKSSYEMAEAMLEARKK